MTTEQEQKELNAARFREIKQGDYLFLFEKEYSGTKQKLAYVIEKIDAEGLPVLRLSVMDPTHYGEKISERLFTSDVANCRFVSTGSKEIAFAFIDDAKVPKAFIDAKKSAEMQLQQANNALEAYDKYFKND